MKAGDRARFFDSRPWQAAGGDHPDGNDRYFRPATVLRVYERESRYGGTDRLCDIRWDTGEMSAAHFYDGCTLPVSEEGR